VRRCRCRRCHTRARRSRLRDAQLRCLARHIRSLRGLFGAGARGQHEKCTDTTNETLLRTMPSPGPLSSPKRYRPTARTERWSMSSSPRRHLPG
jgi:hypothetical protein